VAAGPALSGVARSYRRTLILAAGLGVAALASLIVLGRPIIGVLVCAGLALGAWNSMRVQESFPRVTAEGVVDRRALSLSGLRRLAAVTFVVLVLAVAFHPVGWSAVLGLAAFQVLLVANTAGPLLREVHRG